MTTEVNKKLPKTNDDSFIASLDAYLFARRLQDYHKANNKIDKNLATMLLEVVDTIEYFLESGAIEADEEVEDVTKIIPSFENNVLQAHRMFFCATCNMNVKASGNGLSEHIQKHGNKKLVNTVNQIVPLKPKQTNIVKEIKVKDAFPKKLKEFLLRTDLKQLANTLVHEGQSIKVSPQYGRICTLLQKNLLSKYPNVKIYAFGSVVNGLGHRGSDLDVFIDTNNCFYNRLTKRKMKDIIFNVQRILVNSKMWNNFEPVVHARTPILRAFCEVEKIDCDLSFSNGLSTCNTSLIQYLIELQPLSKEIVVFVKYWASQLDLGINSYLITLMVIFYMQNEVLLPSVKTLQEATHEVLIDGWNANFAQIPLSQLSIHLATDLRKYLIGFFKFYGMEFDFSTYIICVLTGTRVPKHFFDHGNERKLPRVFQKYTQYMESINLDEADVVDDLFSNNKPMVIQDPFELIHNVAKGVQPTKFAKIINYMQMTYEILLDAKFG